MGDPSEKAEMIVAISRVLSKVLRHEPELIGLRLDASGWAAVDELLTKLSRATRTEGASKRLRTLPTVTQNLLLKVVESNDKHRFVLSDDRLRIRAVQGHSVEVKLNHPVQAPPARLFHGTASRNWAAIAKEGLKRGSRHAVHLSVDISTATRIGARHGRPIVIQVATQEMHDDGHEFTVADNGVWLVDSVPPNYLSLVSENSASAFD